MVDCVYVYTNKKAAAWLRFSELMGPQFLQKTRKVINREFETSG